MKVENIRDIDDKPEEGQQVVLAYQTIYANCVIHEYRMAVYQGGVFRMASRDRAEVSMDQVVGWLPFGGLYKFDLRITEVDENDPANN